MKRFDSFLRIWSWIAMGILLSVVSSCIDDDYDKCGEDVEVKYDVNLEVDLETELETQLESDVNTEFSQRLETELGEVFVQTVRDVDLIFYTSDSLIHHAENHKVDGNGEFVIKLPIQDYMHLALGNDDEEKAIRVAGKENAARLNWIQVEGDTIDCHENGLFSARLEMKMKNKGEVFKVQMYMQNAVAGIVVNPKGVKYKEIRGFLANLADGFSVRDSVYQYHDRNILRAKVLRVAENGEVSLYGVGFPSRDVPIPAEKLSRAEGGDGMEEAYWRYLVYVTLPDGKVTETILHVKEPLKAGSLKMVNVELSPDGSLRPLGKEVGVSVEFDWKPGGEFSPEI